MTVSAKLQRYLADGDPWHPIDEASDAALERDGLDRDALRCTTCGRVLTDADWCAAECRWVCPGYAGDGLTEQTAAALRLGKFAPPRRPVYAEPIPGFVQTGPSTYERIASPEPRRGSPPVRHERVPWLRIALWTVGLLLLLRLLA